MKTHFCFVRPDFFSLLYYLLLVGWLFLIYFICVFYISPNGPRLSCDSNQSLWSRWDFFFTYLRPRTVCAGYLQCLFQLLSVLYVGRLYLRRHTPNYLYLQSNRILSFGRKLLLSLIGDLKTISTWTKTLFPFGQLMCSRHGNFFVLCRAGIAADNIAEFVELIVM